ncbi:tetratricopeptide (TPR) repeat protein [Pedobacter sp. UYEF25]
MLEGIDYNIVLKDIDKAVSLNQMDANYYNFRANILSSLNRRKEAFDDYNKAQTLTTDKDVLWTIYFNRAGLRIDLLDYRGAIEDVNRCLAYRRKDADALDIRATAKYELGDYYSAIDDCDKSIEISAFSPMKYYFRGMSKIKLNRKDSGCKDLEMAKSLGEDYRISRAIAEYCQ